MSQKIALIWPWAALSMSLLVGGCAHQQPEMGWVRTDGKTVVPIQLETDQKACDGEREKAYLSEREHKINFGESPLTTVYNFCMAGKGYAQRLVP